MPREKIKECSLEYIQVLNEQGQIDQELYPEGLSEDQIKEMYHLMVLLRTMDEKLFNLQRSGKIGTYAQAKGQEAAQIGSGMAMKEQDWIVPSFREMGVFITKGADRKKLVQAWNGDTRAYHDITKTHAIPTGIPIASQCLHGVGIAWASKLKKEDSVAITYFGDGATSEGDFHEAMNFASSFQLPIVFFCQNNGWAISTPTNLEMNSETVAQKAFAYDMNTVKVDGNDVLAVYRVTKEAIERARSGGGPTFIEAQTFRMGDHTTSDDSLKYRTEELINSWKEKDPIQRLQKYFQSIGTWNEEYGKWVEETVAKEVLEAVDGGLSVEAPTYKQMFEDVYSGEMPWMLKEQMTQLEEELNEKEGGSQK